MIGWRAWGMSHGLAVPPSYGAGMGRYRVAETYDAFWSAPVVVATCPVADEGGVCRSDRVPCDTGRSCIAGLHAYATWRDLQASQRRTRAGRRFAGKIELAGKVVTEPAEGWTRLRAERGRILYLVALRPDARVVEGIAQRWAVPLVVLEAIDPEREPGP